MGMSQSFGIPKSAFYVAGILFTVVIFVMAMVWGGMAGWFAPPETKYEYVPTEMIPLGVFQLEDFSVYELPVEFSVKAKNPANKTLKVHILLYTYPEGLVNHAEIKEGMVNQTILYPYQVKNVPVVLLVHENTIGSGDYLIILEGEAI